VYCRHRDSPGALGLHGRNDAPGRLVKTPTVIYFMFGGCCAIIIVAMLFGYVDLMGTR
jgi:hypothetical protein